MSNTIYHMALVKGNWSLSWDTPGGVTPDLPAAASEGTTLDLVVRGMDNGLWYNSFNFTSGSWSSWQSLGGATLSTPTLTIGASGTLHLVVRGMDNAIWHTIKPTGGSWSATWDSPGGATGNSVAAVSIGSTLAIMVIGLDNSVYYSALTGSSWSTWTSLGGAALAPIELSTLT